MWAVGCSDGAQGAMETTQVSLGTTFSWPELEPIAGEPATWISARAAELLGGGFKTVTWSSLSGALDDYFIIAMVDEAEYLAGHLPGAVHFEPQSDLDDKALLSFLPADGKILVYDCAGQWSSSVAAGLNVLGYDAYFLKFGANSLWCATLGPCAWNGAEDALELPVETD
jgi:sulfur-carrier protein adenylyltransferase/sulfurtransferase